MGEWKRVFLSRKRVFMAVLLTALCLGFYVYSQTSFNNPNPIALKSTFEATAYAQELVERWKAEPVEEIPALADEVRIRLGNYSSWLYYGEKPYDWEGDFTEADAESLISDIPYLYELREDRESFGYACSAFGSAIDELKTQAEYIIGYHDYLDGIQTQAAQQSQIGIFSHGSGFSQKNLLKTAEEFKKLEGVKVEFGANAGVESWLSFDLNDYAFLAAIIVVVLSFLEERRGGLWSAVRSCKRGRLALGLTRLGILAVASVIFTALIYGTTFWMALTLKGGWGDLGRSLQSLESFRTCAIKTTVSGWLVRYFAVRAASGMLTGLLIWCVLGSVANIQFSLSVLGGMLAGEYVLFELLPVQSIFNVLKYFNLFSYVHTADLYTDYLNISLFGMPVGIRPLMMITLPIAAVALAVWAVWMQVKRYPEGNRDVLSKVSAAFNGIADFFRRRLTVGGWEVYKTLIFEFGIVMAAIILILSRSLYCLYGVYEQDRWYQAYLEDLEGPLGEDTADYLARARANAENSYNSYELETSLNRLEAEVEKRFADAEAGGYEPWLVDEKVYESAYGPAAKNAQLRNAAIAILFVAFCSAGIFAFERQAGVMAMIRATKRGRGALFRRKVLCAAGTGTFVWAAVYLKELRDFINYHHPTTFGAPVQNTDSFAGFPLKLNFGQYLILLYGIRLVMLILTALVSMTVSQRCASLQTAYIASVGVLGAPALLATVGVEVLKYVSPLIPIASAQQLWSMGSGDLSAAVPWLIWFAIGVAATVLARAKWCGMKKR